MANPLSRPRGSLSETLRTIGRRLLDRPARRALVRLTRWPPVGWVWLGSLRRLRPISPDWGAERGRPIDRYYIERFLASKAGDIRGRVLEIGDDAYTRQFGQERVAQSEVLHVAETKAKVTIIGDLTNAAHVPSEAFDCIILTQTLQAIFDVPAALRTVHRILKPDGVVLATVPGISKVSRYDMDRWGYFWSFTSQSARRLFSTAFRDEDIQVETYGNVLAAASFLYGLAAEELRRSELEYRDRDFEMLIAVRAVKRAASA
jgi:SAM-dependent methyltransferase